MPRKVIQIASNGGGKMYCPSIIALCDDGTLWEKSIDPDNHDYGDWVLVDNVPQESIADLNLGDGKCAHCGLAKRNKYVACSSCGSKHNKE